MGAWTGARAPHISRLAHTRDVLRAVGLDPAHVLLIRHPLSNLGVRAAVASGQLLPYTAAQDPTFPTQHTYWLVFLGEEANSARLAACYRNGGRTAGSHFALEQVDILDDLSGRLIIDCGRGHRTWKQNGTTASSKPVLAIAERAVDPFPGFENLVLTFHELETVISEPRRYTNWHAALSAVSAIYLVVDTATGRQYVGSATGEAGLLGRWKAYVDTYHGGNKLLVQELAADPSTYSRFPFSVLQILPRSTTPDAAVAIESLYKSKLLSRQFGLNAY